MKYESSRDRNARFIEMQLGSSNPWFTVKGRFTFEMPSPAYHYEMSNSEVEAFARDLQMKWQDDFERKVQEVISKCHENARLGETAMDEK